MVVGWKVWFTTPGVGIQKIIGHSLADWALLPDDGLQIILLYYDEFSTLTCRTCLASEEPVSPVHQARYFALNPDTPQQTIVTRRLVANQPWNELRACVVCGELMNYDSGIRYRRILKGADYYWMAPGLSDFIFGQTDHSPDLLPERYPGLIVKRGRWTDDETFRRLSDLAMSDMQVSDLGISPILGTSDF